MFYSVLWIGYDGIFRLREAKDSLLSMFRKGLRRSCSLFDQGRTQSHSQHCEVSPPKKECSKTVLHQYVTPYKACFEFNVFTGMHKQLALCLHQAVVVPVYQHPYILLLMLVFIPVSVSVLISVICNSSIQRNCCIYCIAILGFWLVLNALCSRMHLASTPNVVGEQMPCMEWALIHRKCGEAACGLCGRTGVGETFSLHGK